MLHADPGSPLKHAVQPATPGMVATLDASLPAPVKVPDAIPRDKGQAAEDVQHDIGTGSNNTDTSDGEPCNKEQGAGQANSCRVEVPIVQQTDHKGDVAAPQSPDTLQHDAAISQTDGSDELHLAKGATYVSRTSAAPTASSAHRVANRIGGALQSSGSGCPATSCSVEASHRGAVEHKAASHGAGDHAQDASEVAQVSSNELRATATTTLQQHEDHTSPTQADGVSCGGHSPYGSPTPLCSSPPCAPEGLDATCVKMVVATRDSCDSITREDLVTAIRQKHTVAEAQPIDSSAARRSSESAVGTTVCAAEHVDSARALAADSHPMLQPGFIHSVWQAAESTARETADASEASTEGCSFLLRAARIQEGLQTVSNDIESMRQIREGVKVLTLVVSRTRDSTCIWPSCIQCKRMRLRVVA
jgi:hypothetical protein